MQATNPTSTAFGLPTGQGANRGERGASLVIVLGVLLAVQLLLALALGLGGRDMGPAASQGALLAFDPAQVTRIQVATPKADPLVIEKDDGAWRIPALGGFPAAEFKVSDLLRKLGQIEKRLPVATSEAALARFKVADDGYERRLTLEGEGGELATLYLGDSPGFRRLFVRAAGDPAVYEAGLALFDAPDKANEWSDKAALQRDEKDIQRIELPDVALERADDGTWRLAGPTAGEELNAEAVADAVRQFADLSFQTVLGSEAKPEYNQDAPALLSKVALASGETVEYRLSKPQEGADYVLKVSDRPQYFGIAPHLAEGLTGIRRSALVGKGEEAAPAADAGSDVDAADAQDGEQAEDEGEAEESAESGAAEAGDAPESP